MLRISNAYFTALPLEEKQKVISAVESTIHSYLLEGWSWNLALKKANSDAGIPYQIVDMVSRLDSMKETKDKNLISRRRYGFTKSDC